MVATRSLADDYAPALAVDSDGRAWIAWASNRTGKYDIYLRSFDGKSWSAEHRVTESQDDAMRPAVAADHDGRVWVAYYKWNRNFGTSRDRDVFARWFHNGQWSDEFLVSPEVLGDHCFKAEPATHRTADIVDYMWIGMIAESAAELSTHVSQTVSMDAIVSR